MTNKEIFIKEIETIKHTLSEEAIQFFDEWKQEKTAPTKGEITELGMKILTYMKENYAVKNSFSAKLIGEGLFLSSRIVSGSIRKLVTDGYVNKINADPVLYEITEKGINI
jgi:Mn-dependent DtxR family transcriptional regulator